MHWSHGLQHLRHKRLTFASAGKSGYTLGFRRKIVHSSSYGETGVFRTGVVSLPSERFTRFGNPAWPGVRTAYFAALGSWPGGALEERRKPSGQRCAYACRCPEGVAAPLGCVIFSVSVGIVACMPCAQGLSACARRGWYHYPRRALRAAETPDGRLPKGLICRFLRLPSSTPCTVTFSANTQISLSAISVANTFALWYDKS